MLCNLYGYQAMLELKEMNADKVAKEGGQWSQSQADIDVGSAFLHLWQLTVQSWF